MTEAVFAQHLYNHTDIIYGQRDALCWPRLARDITPGWDIRTFPELFNEKPSRILAYYCRSLSRHIF